MDRSVLINRHLFFLLHVLFPHGVLTNRARVSYKMFSLLIFKILISNSYQLIQVERVFDNNENS